MATSAKRAGSQKGSGSRSSKGESAKAAAAEAKAAEPEVKRIEYEGLELELPAELPATFLFDITMLESNEGASIMPIMRFLQSALGDEQFVRLRGRIGELERAGRAADIESFITEILELVFGAYGLTLGEASASPDSSANGSGS